VSYLIDRRINGRHKSAVNRDRFVRRFRGQIKEAVDRAIRNRSIKEVDSGENISIPARDISEPSFGNGNGGVWEGVHPGNEEHQRGDRIPRPRGSAGGAGSDAGQDGEGEDDFAFTLTREEFLDYFFEDLALPNLVKTQLATVRDYKTTRAGYTVDGTPANIHVVRSMRGAIGRRIALASPLLAELRDAERELRQLEAEPVPDMLLVEELRERIHGLKTRIYRIPYLDPFDLRYRNRVKVPQPSTQAVMFCLMDVSGSMDEARKDVAKRFFILLYLFLTRNYQRVELVFIRHHARADEVSEEEFFHSRETGGTVVSSALNLMDEIIDKRYRLSEWNIYCAQASDGDNWHDDSPQCRHLLTTRILPKLQYYAYVEITESEPQNLWHEYALVAEHFKHSFAMQRIRNPGEIFPVFRELFKKTHALAY
jgi:uncharacterized sporulation protein YeaH/YhbH (DUF444 family)